MVCQRCDTLLSEFLKAIKSDPSGTKMSEMCNILINHAQSTNSLIQFTAIDWIREFVQLSGSKMLEFASGIFTAILPCLSYEGDSRRGKNIFLNSEELLFDLKIKLNFLNFRHQENGTGSKQQHV